MYERTVLPAVTLKVIEDTLKVFIPFTDYASNEQVSKAGAHRDTEMVSKASSFLLRVGALEQAPRNRGNKRLTPTGRDLAQALATGNAQDTEAYWRTLVLISDYTRDVVFYLRSKGASEYSRLTELILEMYGKKSTRDNIAGAKTIIQILKKANLLIEDDRTGKYAINDTLLYTPVSDEWTESTKKVLFPIEIVRPTPDYIERIAVQANGCYRQGWYDACAVMVRRLSETLIIECFERHGVASKITAADGNYFYLGKLIDTFLSETSWTVGRNTKRSLPQLKDVGDLSAHSRRYTAKEHDLAKLEREVRIVIEELVYIAAFDADSLTQDARA